MAASQDHLPEQQAKPSETGPWSQAWHLLSIWSPVPLGGSTTLEVWGGLCCDRQLPGQLGARPGRSGAALMCSIPPTCALGLQVLEDQGKGR